jgi:hypothetical protein
MIYNNRAGDGVTITPPVFNVSKEKTMTQKLTPNQTKWIAALRSGKYEQTVGKLHDSGGYCCLGVAAKEFVSDDVKVEVNANGVGTYDGDDAEAPLYVMSALGLFDACGCSSGEEEGLTEINDNGASFDRIADLLESDPSMYFKADHTA